MEAIGIIPARYGSTRFPGKVLVKIKGKTMIQRVYEQAKKSASLKYVIVATDDIRIFKEVERFGGKAVMTPQRCKSGTDRVAEVAKRIREEIIVNIQGDEPFLPPGMIEEGILPFKKDKNKKILMGTIATKIKDYSVYNDPNVVKVVVDKDNFALYFSRSPLPYLREVKFSSILPIYKHIGLYIFRRSFLLKFNSLPKSPLEKIEGLEQLRVLENGYRMKVVITKYDSLSIDTPADLKRGRG